MGPNLDLRVLVHSYFPPRVEHLAGGAQLLVNDLLHGLAGKVRCVDVVCPVLDSDDELYSHHNLRVHPMLNEPVEGFLSAAQYEQNLRLLARVARHVDVILTVDRAFPLPVEQPIVLFLNNFSYGTEVNSVFSLTWDAITVPSPYLAAEVEAVVGPDVWQGGARPVRVASPGIDRTHFRPTPVNAALSWLGLDMRRFIAFPHRPDPDKGLDAALDVIRGLRQSGEDVVLLVPRPPRSVRTVRSKEEDYILAIEEQVAEMELKDAVVFHRWVPYSLLPSYLSLAECCLAPTRLPEAFGLVVLQAISCGTPVVATPGGAIPDLLPAHHGLTIVPFNDIDALTSATRSALWGGAVSATRGATFIETRYSVDRFVEQFLTHLATTTKSSGRYVPLDSAGPVG